MLEHFDLLLLQLVNGWCGNWTLDRIAGYEEGNNLYKGGLMLAVYWYFWFARSSQRDERRRTIVAAALGSFVALAVNRSIAMALPFRVRPMYEAGIPYHAPSIAIPFNLEHWSSFPSDTATYFFALAFGVFALSRPLSLLLMLYSAVWICLPRLYLGVHYPSDLIVGALIGVAGVWAVQRWGGRRAAGPILAAERSRPGLFYVAAFVVSYEMAMIFDDVRNVLHGVVHGLQVAGRTAAGRDILLGAIGAMLLLAAAAGIALIRARPAECRAKAGLTAAPPVDGES